MLSPTLNLFILGALVHFTIFRHDEWDLQTNKLIIGGILAGVVPAFISIRVFGLGSDGWLEFAAVSGFVAGVFLTGIASSMIVYRLFLHRTRSFPGPWQARLSGWYWSYLYARRLHLYDEMMALHAEYGDFVRIGKDCPSTQRHHAQRACRTEHHIYHRTNSNANYLWLQHSMHQIR